MASLAQVVELSRINDQKERERSFSEALEIFLKRSGLGRMYWDIEPEMIIPKQEINEYTTRLQDNISEGKGLIIIGGVGVGKTCILSYLMQRDE